MVEGELIRQDVVEQVDPSFARLVSLQIISSSSGVLGVAESSKHIGFTVRRVYFLTGLNPHQHRGAHGHQQLRQCFICLRGSVTISVIKDNQQARFTLSDYNQGLQVDAGCWRDLYNWSDDALLVVLASQEYDEADYIRDYEDFQSWEAEKASVVPYLDLSRYSSAMHGALEGAVHNVMSSGVFIGGPSVRQFEEAFSTYCGAALSVGVGNGLDALSLALKARGVGPGDEVIVPAHTFIATALAVDAVGAQPVLVDVEEDTGLIDPRLIAEALTERTRAVVPVHLYGHPADMDGVRAALGGRDIFVLEDAAQAHGAEYKGRRCGSLGDAAGFSFYPTKNLGALGDGGAVTTSIPELAREIRLLGNYGSAEKYHHLIQGGNSRLDPINAAVLSAKLEHLDDWNERRRTLARIYKQHLTGLEGLELPSVRSWAKPVWHVFPIRVAPDQRESLMATLRTHGVGVNIHYPIPVHRQACYAGRWRRDFAVADRLAASLLSLPLDPTHSEDEIVRTATIVQDFFRATT